MPPGIAGTIIGAQIFSREGAEKDERAKAIQDLEVAKILKDQEDEVKIIMDSAYRRLKNPLARAAYLCALHGVDLEAESNTAMPPAFLMQQMEWRDALSEAATLDAVDALADEVAAARDATLRSLQAQIDGVADVDWRAVAGVVRGLMFVDKFMSDIDKRVDALS